MNSFTWVLQISTLATTLRRLLHLRYLFGLLWFYGISNIVGYLIPNPFFIYVLDICYVNTFGRYMQINDQAVLFLTNPFSISRLFALSLNVKQFFSIQFNWPIDRTLSGVTTPGQSGPRSNVNQGLLWISYISLHYWSLPLRSLSYSGQSLVGGGRATIQQRSIRCILLLYLTGLSCYVPRDQKKNGL